MISKHMAAAAAALCLIWGAAYAENPQGTPGVPEGVGATDDVVILEIGPMQGGAASAEEMAAMQMLLLQLLLMQSEVNAGGGDVLMAPRAPAGLEI